MSWIQTGVLVNCIPDIKKPVDNDENVRFKIRNNLLLCSCCLLRLSLCRCVIPVGVAVRNNLLQQSLVYLVTAGSTVVENREISPLSHRPVQRPSSQTFLAMGFPLMSPSTGINYNFVAGAYLVCSLILGVLFTLDKVSWVLQLNLFRTILALLLIQVPHHCSQWTDIREVKHRKCRCIERS